VLGTRIPIARPTTEIPLVGEWPRTSSEQL
jgi:hypothetical protein